MAVQLPKVDATECGTLNLAPRPRAAPFVGRKPLFGAPGDCDGSGCTSCKSATDDQCGHASIRTGGKDLVAAHEFASSSARLYDKPNRTTQ